MTIHSLLDSISNLNAGLSKSCSHIPNTNPTTTTTAPTTQTNDGTNSAPDMSLDHHHHADTMGETVQASLTEMSRQARKGTQWGWFAICLCVVVFMLLTSFRNSLFLACCLLFLFSCFAFLLIRALEATSTPSVHLHPFAAFLGQTRQPQRNGTDAAFADGEGARRARGWREGSR
jgi:hypothetical protein